MNGVGLHNSPQYYMNTALSDRTDRTWDKNCDKPQGKITQGRQAEDATNQISTIKLLKKLLHTYKYIWFQETDILKSELSMSL